MELRVPMPVASVISSDVETQRKVGKGDCQLAPLEDISSLVTRLLRTAQEGRLADVKVPPEEGRGSSSIVISCAVGRRCGKRSLSNEVGKGVFLMRTAGTWGELVFAGGHFFSVLVAGLVGGCSRYGLVELEGGLLREMRDGFPPLRSHPTEVRGQDKRQLPVRAKSVLGSRERDVACRRGLAVSTKK